MICKNLIFFFIVSTATNSYAQNKVFHSNNTGFQTRLQLCRAMTGPAEDMSGFSCIEANKKSVGVVAQARAICGLERSGRSYNGPSQNCVPCYFKAAELLADVNLKSRLRECENTGASSYLALCGCMDQHFAKLTGSSSEAKPKAKPKTKPKNKKKPEVPISVGEPTFEDPEIEIPALSKDVEEALNPKVPQGHILYPLQEGPTPKRYRWPEKYQDLLNPEEPSPPNLVTPPYKSPDKSSNGVQ